MCKAANIYIYIYICADTGHIIAQRAVPFPPGYPAAQYSLDLSGYIGLC